MDLNGSSCTTLTAAAMRTVPRAKKGEGGGGYRGKEKDRKERELKRRQLAQRGKGETVPDGVSLSLSLPPPVEKEESGNKPTTWFVQTWPQSRGGREGREQTRYLISLMVKRRGKGPFSSSEEERGWTHPHSAHHQSAHPSRRFRFWVLGGKINGQTHIALTAAAGKRIAAP